MEDKYFAMTINKNYRVNAKMENSDYSDILLDMYDSIRTYTFEKGNKQGRLHCHVLLKMSQDIYDRMVANNSFRYKGFYVYVTECENHEAWLQYINKEKSFFS